MQRDSINQQPGELEGTSLWQGLAPEKRTQVEQAALDEFAASGYSRASMNSLSRKAGVSKGSIFSYFRSKSGLFDTIVKTALEKVRELLREVRNQSRGRPFDERLLAVMEAGLGFIDEHPLLARIYFQLLRTEDTPFGNAWLQRMNGEAREFLSELVEEGQAAGELRGDLPAGEVAFTLNAVLEHMLAARQNGRGDATDPWRQEDPASRREGLRRQCQWLLEGLRSVQTTSGGSRVSDCGM